MDPSIHAAITRAILRTTKTPEDGISSAAVVTEMDRDFMRQLKRWKRAPDDELIPVEPRRMWHSGGQHELGNYQDTLERKAKKHRPPDERQFTFLDDNISFDRENPDLRKFYGDLVAAEARKAIERLTSMAEMSISMRNRLVAIFRDHPEWESEKPHWTLAQILGFADPPTP